MATLDPSLYGGTALPIEPTPVPAPATKEAVQVTPPAFVATDDLLAPDAPSRVASEQARESVSTAPSTAWEGIQAAWYSTDTMRAVRALNDSTDDDNDGPQLTPKDAIEYVNNLPRTPSEDERKHLLSAKTLHGMGVRWQRIEEQRKQQEIASDHMALSFAVYAADPIQVFAGLGAGKVAGLANMSRLASMNKLRSTARARAAFGLEALAAPVASTAGRTTSIAASAAVPLAIEAAADADMPRTFGELLIESVASGVGGAMSYRHGMGLVKRDLEYPHIELNTILAARTPKYRVVQREVEVDEVIPAHTRYDVVHKGRVVDGVLVEKPVLRPVEVPEQIVRKTVQKAVFEEVPEALAPGRIHTEPGEVAGAVDTLIAKDPPKVKPKHWIERFGWNINKSFGNFGAVGRETGDFLTDAADLAQTSVESIKAAKLTEFRMLEQDALDGILGVMKTRGAGLFTRFTQPRKAAAIQDDVVRQVQREMERQQNLHRVGKPIARDSTDPAIFDIAEKYNLVHKKALEEMKAAGIKGAENLEYSPGYYSRAYSAFNVDRIIKKFAAVGKEGDIALKRMVAAAIAKANPNMPSQIAYDVGASIINRTIRKGELADTNMLLQAGEGQLKLMRDVLQEEVNLGNLTHGRMERVLDHVRQQTEDAGKAGYLKHRVVMDTEHGEFVGDEWVQVSDLFDHRMETTVHRYLDRVSGQVAFARKGVTSVEGVAKMRERLVQSVPFHQRQKAAELFDNTVDHLMGRPSGEGMNDAMRLMGAYNRAVVLGMSGIWQVVEAATMMGKYGIGNTLKYTFKEFPVIRSLLEDASKSNARSLDKILNYHAGQNLRLKPFMYRFEDGFDVPPDAAVQLAAQQMNQLVPYANGMKFIQDWQGKVATNLIMDRLEKAAQGNAKMRGLLAKYGLEPGVVDKIAVQMERHSWDVDKWDDAVWNATGPSLFKMLDEIVLKSRLGDTPAFVQFDKAGKFIFTFRNFVLTAHNKLTVGGTARDGAGATALIMMYQIPLAALAVNTASVLKGDGPLSQEDLSKQTGAQLSVLGLFGEAAKILTGQSTGVGSPGTIVVDRGVRMAGAVTRGDGAKAASLATQLIPVLSAVPVMKGTHKLIED